MEGERGGGLGCVAGAPRGVGVGVGVGLLGGVGVGRRGGGGVAEVGVGSGRGRGCACGSGRGNGSEGGSRTSRTSGGWIRSGCGCGSVVSCSVGVYYYSSSTHLL